MTERIRLFRSTSHWPAIAVCCLTLLCCANQAGAVTLWSEDAENGTVYVVDNSDSSYELIQSQVVAQGSHAFHLANPGFQDNSFVLERTITIQPDTKLFFLSQLRAATTRQLAKVQISNNGGFNWSTDVFSQAGSGLPGEGSFRLKQIGLGDFYGQDLQFRFLYDFTGGSAFTQTDSQVGWFVDSIQLGSDFEKVQFSIGDPSPHAQEYLEYINRARAEALVEAERLASESDPEIRSAYNFFGIDGQEIVDQFQWYVDNNCIDRHAQPLSFQSELLETAELHTQDMFANRFQGHDSSADPPEPFQPRDSFDQRLDRVGYDGVAAENVFAFADSVAQGHAGFDVDWGHTSNPSRPCYNPAFTGDGMQNPAGHRRSIHNGDFKEIGIGVINGRSGNVGPQIVTQDLGDPGDVTYLTGVVYEDLNANDFYDVGEGRSGVRVDVEGSPYFAVSSTSGAYSIPLSADGSYDVFFSGGGYAAFQSQVTVTDGRNAKVDYLVSLAVLVGDFDANQMVDATDYTLWRDTLGSSGDLRADGSGNGIVGPEDYDLWNANYGMSPGSLSGRAAVPEPRAWLMVVTVGLLISSRRPITSHYNPCLTGVP